MHKIQLTCLIKNNIFIYGKFFHIMTNIIQYLYLQKNIRNNEKQNQIYIGTSNTLPYKYKKRQSISSLIRPKKKTTVIMMKKESTVVISIV